MPRIILILALLLLTLQTHAQETYADIQRRKENKAYNEAYIDALRRPNTNNKNSGGVDAKAAQELADLFAARAGKETPAQKAAREKLEQEKYDAFVKKQEADYQAYRLEADAKQAKEDMIYGPIRKKYELAGFSYGEGEFLALSGKTVYFPAASALQEFNETWQTAGFEDLFRLVNEFKITGYAAMLAVDKLKKRFPEKTVLLDAAAINLMIGSWTEMAGTRSAFNFLPGGLQSQMLNYFEDAYDKNPELVFAQLNGYRLDFFTNPFNLVAYDYSKNKKDKQAKKFRQLNGQYVMNVLKRPIITDVTIPQYFSGAYQYISAYPITLQDLKEICEGVKEKVIINPRQLIEYFLGLYPGSLRSLGSFKAAYKFDHAPILKANKFDVLIKQMADEGDLEAMNTYALMVSTGETKEPRQNAIATWKKLADQGLVYALYNLAVATQASVPFPGYGMEQQPAELARWNSYTSTDKNMMKEWTALGGAKLEANMNYWKNK